MEQLSEGVDAVPCDLPATCEAAVAKFLASVRSRAQAGPVGWRIVLFAHDTAGWRTIVIDPDGTNDLDGEIIWGANRMAKILRAEAAAFVEENGGSVGAVVYVERRGERGGTRYRIGRGEREPIAEHIALTHEILPGGEPGGWGDADHASILHSHGGAARGR